MDSAPNSPWTRQLTATAERYRPTWQQWRAWQAGPGRPANDPREHDDTATFTPRELERMRFLRWLLASGRLTP